MMILDSGLLFGPPCMSFTTGRRWDDVYWSI